MTDQVPDSGAVGPGGRDAMRESRIPDHRGHLFDRSVENGSPVLRCRWPECKHIWWPDENKPSKPCPISNGPTRSSWPQGCKGWNYHVWSLGMDKCSMCGVSRTEVEAIRRVR